MNLPPLPMPEGTLYGPDRTIKGHAYTAATVRKYAEAAIAAAVAARDEAWADAVAPYVSASQCLALVEKLSDNIIRARKEPTA